MAFSHGNKVGPQTKGGLLLLEMFNEASENERMERAASNTHAAELRRALGVSSPFASLAINHVKAVAPDSIHKETGRDPAASPDTVTTFVAEAERLVRAASMGSAFSISKK